MPRHAAATLLFLAGTIAAGAAQAHAINGALYTTTANGQTVNGNNYPFKSWVFINGGPEELGWRGFALPRLQERFSPVRATLVLGTIWGLWHLPLLRVEDNAGHDLATLPLIAMLIWTLGGFIAYAFTYTFALNRTGSVFLCMVLHAAYNTALGVVILAAVAIIVLTYSATDGGRRSGVYATARPPPRS